MGRRYYYIGRGTSGLYAIEVVDGSRKYVDIVTKEVGLYNQLEY